MNTRKFEDLGYVQLRELSEMILSMIEDGVPKDFYDDGVVWEFNPNSGNMFFTNDDYQVCMMNGGKLESFYWLSYDGHAGFAEDLKENYENGCITNEEDIQQLIDLGIIEEIEEDEEVYYE